jgi:hypothetical protein
MQRQEVMTMMQMKHWQDPANALIGAWLVVSPWALGFQHSSPALSNSVIIGMALLATALGALFVPQAWEEWTEAGLGLWMVLAPWLFGFSNLGAATANALVCGFLVLALALWVLATDKDWGFGRDRPAH